MAYPRSLLALLYMATLWSLWLLAGSISVARWLQSILWALCFPFIWPVFLLVS